MSAATDPERPGPDSLRSKKSAKDSPAPTEKATTTKKAATKKAGVTRTAGTEDAAPAKKAALVTPGDPAGADQPPEAPAKSKAQPDGKPRKPGKAKTKKARSGKVGAKAPDRSALPEAAASSSGDSRPSPVKPLGDELVADKPEAADLHPDADLDPDAELETELDPDSEPDPGADDSPAASPIQDPPDRARESRWSTRDREREQELLALLAELPEGDPRRAAARDELVTMHMPLAAFLARRFRDRGEHLDDLTQVATVGLIKAVDRFEPGRGVEFSTFATPTIVGEIKRHFRDKGWAIRVPRRLQELRLAITRATAELSQQTGSSPTVPELAAHLGISEDEVLEGLESAAAYATVSLDSTAGGGDSSEDGGGASIAETVGDHDPSLIEVEHRATLNPLLARLGEREQRIVYMRFYENKTQAQIAAEIGVSQMHISRLLAKSLAQMRTGLVEA